MRIQVLMLGLVLACPGPAETPARVQRLAAAARVWARLRWVHPVLGEGRVDWDQALVDVLPALERAATPEAQRAALAALVAPLRDPATRVAAPAPPEYVRPAPGAATVQDLPGGRLLVSLHEPPVFLYAEDGARAKAYRSALAAAQGVVFDLRPTQDYAGAGLDQVLEALLAPVLPEPVTLPALRVRTHRGWALAAANGAGYFSGWTTHATRTLRPAAGARRLPLAFIVDARTPVPAAALGLQKAGLAHLVSAGPLDPACCVPCETRTLAPGVALQFPTGQLLFADGTTGAGADREVPAAPELGPGCAAVQAALALFDAQVRPGAAVAWTRQAILPPHPVSAPAPEPPVPDLARRRLAVIQFWAVADAFYPYKELLDRPWDAVLPEFLARMEGAADAAGYARTLMEMGTRLQDNHVGFRGHPGIAEVWGEAGLPWSLRKVEGAVLVAEAHGSAGADAIRPWDELLAVDGVPVAELMRRLEPVVPAANPWTLDRNLLGKLGRGPEGSVARVQVRGAGGTVREARLTRSRGEDGNFLPVRDGEVIRILPGGVGYADLGRLLPSQVDDLFDQVKATRALVLDMRGYPNGTAWAIAPRLDRKGAQPAARFTVQVVSGDDEEPAALSFLQRVPPGDGRPPYPGRVLLLVDERSQSQAEHTGLMLAAACDLTLVGSPTAGSDGDLTTVRLPGGFRVSFSGQGVAHPDGRRLQRTGLVPSVAVKPTIQGLRQGRDEVLERALAFLAAGH